MATMINDGMPPKPVCEFDFNLPHGMEFEESTPTDINQHDDNHHCDSTEDHPHSQEPGDYQSFHDSMDNMVHTADPDADPQISDEVEFNLNYGSLPKGFSDDDGSADELENWHSNRARKSPKRVGNDEDSPRTKRPRQSLFGAPLEDDDESRAEDYFLEHDSNMHEPKTPGQGIRDRMSSLNLEQQERQDSPSERPFTRGFSIASPDRNSISPRASPAPSEESFIIPPDDQPAYELRTNIERKKAFTSIDNDQSGNFDPAEEAKQKASKLNKAKAAKIAQQKKTGQQHASKSNVMKCIVKLHFEALGNVRNITNDEQYWPDDWSELDSECEREAQEWRDFFRDNTPDREMQVPIEDPGGKLDDLTGYPAARGCKCCREHELGCSMIEGGTYPCTQCVDEGAECELICPPTVKGRCKQCIEDGVDECSFEYDPDQAICDQCAEHESICDALPPTGYKAERISINEIMYGPDRPFAQCTVCRREKKRCSLKKTTDKPPCRYCKKHSIGCTFYEVPRVDNKKKAGGGKAKGLTEGGAPEVAMPGNDYFTAEDLEDMMRGYDDIESRETTPEVEMDDVAGNKGILTKITTSFAHPIKFNVGTQEVSDCSFCEMPVFGFIGYFESEVHVIRWHNGCGYTEVGGGYCEDKGPTTMCEPCTIMRLQVLMCPGHGIQRFVDDDPNQDFDAVAGELISTESGTFESRCQLQRWCSMCFSVATFGCGTVQPDLSGEDETEIDGCGLRLCDRCEISLREEFGSDIDQMATFMDDQPKMSEFDDGLQGKARADVGFLRHGGLLMNSVSADADA